MPNIVSIGISNQILGISNYDVYVSECEPTNWQLVATDLTYDQFPYDVNLDFWGVTSDCYQYKIETDTGCVCENIGWVTTPTPTPTITPTISLTPTITPTITPSITTTPTVTPTSVSPTPTPTISITPTITPSITITPTPTPLPCELVDISEFTPYGETVNIFSIYAPSPGAGSNQQVSICDWVSCSSLDSSYSGVADLLPYTGTCGIFLEPGQSLPTQSGEEVPIFYTGSSETDCVPFTTSSFEQCGFFNITIPFYVMYSANTGTTVYQINTGSTVPSGEYVITMYGTCDYYGGLGLVNGFEVTLSESGEWLIDGQVNPTLNLICGQEYHFHICETGATEGFFIANEFDLAGTFPANELAVTEGVTNNGVSLGTVRVTFDTDLSSDGGYWYGQEDSLTNYGQINFVQSCTGVTINNTNQSGVGYNLLFEYELCDGTTQTQTIQGGNSVTINDCIIPETITVTLSGPNANPSLWNYSGGDCCS